MEQTGIQKIDLIDAELPVFRPVAVRIVNTCADPNHTQSELIHTILLDPVSTATVLSAANAFMHVKTVEKAVKVMGSDSVRATLLTAICGDTSREDLSENAGVRFNMAQHWMHAVTCSLCARELMTLTQAGDADEAGIAGLLHDIGKTALYQYDPARYIQAFEKVERSNLAVEEVERSVFGVDHTVVGRWLLEHWSLPSALQEAVWLHHHAPPAIETPLGLVGCIHLANLIAHAPPFEPDEQLEHDTRIKDALHHLGISEEQYDALCDRVQKTLSHLVEHLPPSDAATAAQPKTVRTARTLLQRHVQRLGTTTRTQERRVRMLEALNRLDKQVSSTTDIEQILFHITRAACQGMCLESVHSGIRLADGRVIRGEATGIGPHESGVSMMQTVTIDAGEWGLGTLTAIYDSEAHVPEMAAWLEQFAELAARTITYIQRYDRARYLSDRAVHAVPETSTAVLIDKDERLEQLNEMAGHMAHVFNNLFAGILGRTQLLLKRPDDQPRLLQGLQTIEQSTLKGTRIIQQLQLASRADFIASSSPVDFRSLIDRVVDEHQPSLSDQDIDVIIDIDGTAAFMGQPDDLHMMLTQLMINAIEAMQQGGTVSITTSTTPDAVTLTVHDTGCGIPVSIRDRIFEPFFTTKSPQSVGLGLSLVRRIVLRHYGQIEVTSEEDKSTTVLMTFPSNPETSVMRTEGNQIVRSNGRPGRD